MPELQTAQAVRDVRDHAERAYQGRLPVPPDQPLPVTRPRPACPKCDAAGTLLGALGPTSLLHCTRRECSLLYAAEPLLLDGGFRVYPVG